MIILPFPQLNTFSASNNASSNTITLTVDTGNPDDSFSWTQGSFLSFNLATNNQANITLSSSYNSTSVSVSATGNNPNATSASTFIFRQKSNIICSNLLNNNIYLGSKINAYYSGCSSTTVTNGTSVAFVAPEISLNAGFEVVVGGTFSANTQ